MDPKHHEKQSYEKHRVKIDFSGDDRIISGDSLNAATLSVKAFDDDETDVSSTIIASSSVSGNYVYVWLQAGTDGEDYDIRVRIDTTLGEKLEDDLILQVIDKKR